MPSGYSTVCELEAMARLVRWFTYIQLLNERVKLPEGKYTQFFFCIFGIPHANDGGETMSDFISGISWYF